MIYQDFIYFLWFLFFANQVVKGKNGCKDLQYLPCVRNKTFKGHVIESFKFFDPGLSECQSKCFKNDNCVSYNLESVFGNRKICELNEYDHVTHPNDVIEMEGSQYCPIKNPCSSNPCTASGVFCIPDFYWDSYTCRSGAWSAWSAWSLCGCPHRIPRRIRSCRNPLTNVIATDCPGTGQEQSSAVCSSMRDCSVSSALGMEDGKIADGQINASSSYLQDYCQARQARLNQHSDNAWCSGKRETGQFIQIDLGAIKTITKIATQGRNDRHYQWVTKYTIAYFCEDVPPLWITYIEPGTGPKYFNGNTDRNTIVFNPLPLPIRTRHIRLIVQGFHSYPSLRMELYGC